MRNLKRALSLTLASVMLLGMMVVGSSAAGYPDVAEDDNVEAIEVVQSVGVMVGDENGNFRPGDSVSRAEMAVVMGKLLNLDYNYYEAVCPFTDVSGVYDWARGWVGAAAANGIVSGRGDGIYDPAATVTAVEAASMMMRALGYFKYQNDYADGFEVSTVRLGTTIGIFDGVGSSATEPMTRNQVAQMVLNALQSAVVEPDGNTINLTTPDGTVYTGKVNYVSVTSAKSFATAISRTQATSVGSQNDGWIVELGERLYDGKLKLDDSALDPFGRPSRKWEYDGKAIGTYAKKELMVFDNVGKVVGTDLYNLLGATTLKDYDLRVAVDGIADLGVYNKIANSVRDNSNTGVVFNKTDLNRNNKAKIGATGTGVLTQVFVDHETDDIYVAIINTYLAIADKGYDEKKEEASIEVFDIDKDLSADEYAKTAQRPDAEQSEKFKLGNEDFDLVKDIAKDDAYLVTVAEGEIQTIVPAEVLSEVGITSFKRNDFVVSGGSTYNYTTTAGYNYKDLEIYTSENGSTENLKDRTYNIYLDAYGNLIGLKEVEATKNYVFVSSIDRNGSYIANRTANANVVFLDGTSDVISIDMIKSEWRNNRANGSSLTSAFVNGDNDDGGSSLLNTWCTYTKNGDVYTVREVYNVIDATTTDKTPGGLPVSNGDAVAARAPEGTTNGTTLAQFHDVERTSEITLKNGLRLNGGFTTGNAYSNIYGDSDSVYLTAELGTVRATDGNVYGIIKGADTVYTGIDGTSISIWSKLAAQKEANKEKNSAKLDLDVVNANGNTTTYGGDNAFGVYTLFNDEGIIIASMIVGEGSSSKDLVYVTSGDAKLETYNGDSDGLWTWEREVVRNGEKVTLTEVGDNVDALSKDNMKNHHWYEVKTDGKGNVTKAEPAYAALDTWTGNPNNSRSVFVGDYKNINNAIENEATDTVLFHQDNGNSEEVNRDGYTYTHAGFNATQDLAIQGKNLLAVTNTQGSGIYFRNDVHVVLEYWNRNVDGIDVMVGDGVDDLKDMVDFVNENNDAAIARQGGRLTNETYYVSALIEDGAATTIVIYDRFNNYNRPGTGEQTKGNVTAAKDLPILPNDGTYGDMSVSRLGKVDLTVTFKAPDWAAVNTADADVTSFNVVISDDQGTVMTLTKGDFTYKAGSSFTYTGNNGRNSSLEKLETAIADGKIDGSKLKAEITSITWKYAGVKYVLTGGVALTTDNGLTAGYTNKLQIGNGSPAALGFTYTLPSGSVAAEAGIKYEVSNARTSASADAPKGNITSGSAVSVANAYANNNGWVTVTISGVEKDTTVVPPTTKYTVESKAADAIEFAMVDAKPAAAANLPADGDWKTKLPEAEAGKIILVRSATGDALASTNGLQASNVYDMDKFPQVAAGVTVANDISGASEVYYFTMPACNVGIKAVKTTKIVVEHGYVAKDGSVVNLQTAEAPTALDTNAKKVKFAADWINANVSGMTARPDTNFAGNDILVLTKGGKDVEVAAGAVTVNNNLFWVTVDDDDYVAADATAVGMDDVLGKLKTSDEVTALGSYYTKVTAAADSSVTAVAANDTSDLTKGDVIDTNNGEGYIKLTSAAGKVTVTVDVTGIDSALTGTPTGELKAVTSASGFVVGTDTSAETYVKPGADLTATIKNSKDEKVAAGKDVQAKIALTTSADATVGGAYQAATTILTDEADFNQTPGIDLTFTLTPTKADMSAINVILTGIATPVTP